MSVAPPTYRTPQIADLGDELARQFHEIEACALRGVLAAMREVESYSPLIADALWQILAWPEQHPGPAAACAKREEWFAAAVRRFQHALQPGRISFEVVSRGQNSWMRVFHQGEKVSIRVGQMVAQRRWGAHYWSRNSAVDLEIAHSTIQGALNRFQSDVVSINRWCMEWATDARFLSSLDFAEDRLGHRFEALIQGILNETAELAYPATLYADAREWTDLKVRMKALNRTVPVQVKFFAIPNDQDAVVVRNRRADEVVLVSPIELARFLEAHFDPEQFGCDWAHFLELFPNKPRNLVQLSWELYQLFRRFLDRPITHPLDPVHSVPALLKKAIFALLEARAPTLVIPDKPPSRLERRVPRPQAPTPP